jgi:hypothetical protein
MTAHGVCLLLSFRSRLLAVDPHSGLYILRHQVVQAVYLASLDQRLMSTHQRFALTISLKNLFAPTFFALHLLPNRPRTGSLACGYGLNDFLASPSRQIASQRSVRFHPDACASRLVFETDRCRKFSKMIAVNGSLSRKGNLPDGL